MLSKYASIFVGLIVGLSAGLSVCRADFDKLIDSPMYHLPDVPAARVVFDFPEEAKDLWLRALARPESEMKCQAARSIAVARQHGIKGMETTIEPLRAVLDQRDQPPLVLLAVARALVALDARQAADSLFRKAQSGDGDLRAVVEPALAGWDHKDARAVWLERLGAPTTRTRDLILAIQCLAKVREDRAADRLREMVLDKRGSGPVRLEAARALGTIRTAGLEKDAERLAAEASAHGIVDRLVAAFLLRHHGSAESIRLLQRFTHDAEPTAAAVAVARLLEIDPELLVPSLEHLLASPDAILRSFAVDVLHRRPTEKHVRLLSKRLDDPHLDVRRKARGYLYELARDKKWHEQILADATEVLKSQGWRGLEQATILLTQLDHKPAARRFVELLSSNRPEVLVSAAWGLRKLDVPETLPLVVRFIEEDVKKPLVAKVKAPPPPPKAPARPGSVPPPPPQEEERPNINVRDHAISQLNQFLGQRKYRPAEKILRQFVPKFAFGFVGEARAAAIWALGMILDGQTDAALAQKLEERLNDMGSIPPEDFRVRWMCAITIGRMKSQDSVACLRTWFQSGEPTIDPVNNACGWAIERITGEKMPPAKTVHKLLRDWFLVPN